ncbi:MAG: exodeoxyribonuclease V subunit alpha [Chlorobiaceae bacterium]|nr:exodeoxyribonuclease V subunit alpha [Chlorobiaceae bacterium]
MSMEYLERAIDRHFADFICRQEGRSTDEVFRLVISMASSAVGKGSSCLDLAGIAGRTVIAGSRDYRLPELKVLTDMLKISSVVSFQGREHRPLVLEAAGRLYLFRYWQYEQELSGMLLQKAGAEPGVVDDLHLHEVLQRLFPGNGDREEDLQKKAAAAALHRRFTVISGGPGTGKTSTVVRILALLLEQPGEGRRIALAAPTGKAVARLKSSISKMKGSIDCPDEVRSAISNDVVTIHGLLGTIPGSARFRHSPENPLPFDTVIIDEASMVALPLMHALVSATLPDTRLLLIGDMDQLASVEAGSAFSDICEAAAVKPHSAFGSCMVKLEKNYRFSESEGIARLGRMVAAGNEKEVIEALESGSLPGIHWHPAPIKSELRRFLAPRVIEGYRSFLEAATPAEALERFDRFRVLCVLRDGHYGVSGLNSEIESILSQSGFIKPADRFYRRCPVLVTVNDYALRLFNGDTGILFNDSENRDETRVFFSSTDGGMRSIPPERLPQHETAYAMTVHKSQGSEFDSVLIILPTAENEILTRELLYTGITRARYAVELVSDRAVVSFVLRKKIKRQSGFFDKLLL